MGSPPAYAIIDECQHFVSPEVQRVLTETRKFNLRLILAVRSPIELEDTPDAMGDRLKRLVFDLPQCKIMFGGLGHLSAQELAWEFWGHLLDWDERKYTVKT